MCEVIFSLPLLPGPLKSRVASLFSILSMGQIDLFKNYSLLIEIFDTMLLKIILTWLLLGQLAFISAGVSLHGRMVPSGG